MEGSGCRLERMKEMFLLARFLPGGNPVQGRPLSPETQI
jgi:hypothetical protein